MHLQLGLIIGLVVGGSAAGAPKVVPLAQVVPLPNEEISFQREGIELTRYHFGPDLRRPFLYPVIGASGRSLTRMGHPHDPVSHSHHNSIWISHNSVDGVSFWDDRSSGRIVHQRVEKLADANEAASVLVLNAWKVTNQVLLMEKRLMTMRPLPRDEWMLLVDVELQPNLDSVTFGKTPFGLAGVRMAKSIGVNDGGGEIRNSEGGINETNVLWRRARWVDYSGPIKTGVMEGITLMDHPSNPNHPTYFHVRNDGWMGASLTFEGPRVVHKAHPLKLRYAWYIHRGAAKPEAIDKQWRSFAEGSRSQSR